MGYKIFLWSFSIFSLSQKDQNIHVVICNCLFSLKNMAKNSHFWWWEKLKLYGQKKWCIWCCAYANCKYIFPLYFGTCNQKPRKMTENPQNWLQCFVHYYVQRRIWYLSKWYKKYLGNYHGYIHRSNESMCSHPIKNVRNGHDALQSYRQDQFFLNLHEKWI